ncbi:GNAT family N-acetyltransferase [Nocardioides albidus]|uniref:GNAT family N-acetyltransferase n=1 Tax=Nocardioides albidus TaxID=1517589 RepID=A0A5C4VLE8_9ACTN|nr:GNAT family protein [Nocardioides albidus]TNM36597.1 GNAT family N-acetyltransferase [Nocardioides albidus]
MTTASTPPAQPAPPLPLATGRLVLRTVLASDGAAIGAYCADPEVTRYLPFAALDAEGLAERMARLVAATAPSVPGESLCLAVLHDDVLVGDVMLRLTDRHGPQDPPAIGELGWVFSPEYAGRGFATEAARALVDLAFTHYPLHRLMARLDPRNVASARLCERLGMTREAHTREDYADRDGTWSDTAVYGLLRREWAGS